MPIADTAGICQERRMVLANYKAEEAVSQSEDAAFGISAAA